MGICPEPWPPVQNAPRPDRPLAFAIVSYADSNLELPAVNRWSQNVLELRRWEMADGRWQMGGHVVNQMQESKTAPRDYGTTGRER